jgi:hypothetical protein
VELLRSLTPGQRLQKAFELSELSRALFFAGLRKRFPHATGQELHQILLDRLAKCHNRNY